jgi:hypothetical protein
LLFFAVVVLLLLVRSSLLSRWCSSAWASRASRRRSSWSPVWAVHCYRWVRRWAGSSGCFAAFLVSPARFARVLRVSGQRLPVWCWGSDQPCLRSAAWMVTLALVFVAPMAPASRLWMVGSRSLCSRWCCSASVWPARFARGTVCLPSRSCWFRSGAWPSSRLLGPCCPVRSGHRPFGVAGCLWCG